MKKKRSAFVPSVIFTTACIGVIPACALEACGGSESTGGGDSGIQQQGVAACAFDGSCQGVGACAFDSSYGCGVATVAYMGFDATPDGADTGTGDGTTDALGVADVGFSDADDAG